MTLHIEEALFVSTFAFVVNMLCVMASRVLLQRMSLIKNQKKEDRLLDIAQFITIQNYSDIEHILWSVVVVNVVFFIPLNWVFAFKIFVRHQVGLILRSFFNVLTFLPSPNQECKHMTEPWKPDGQCNDLMFSGHQLLFSLLVAQLFKWRIFNGALCLVMMCLHGLILSSTNRHYTIDTAVAPLVVLALETMI